MAFQVTPGWLPFRPSPSKPRFVPPPGAVDTHCGTAKGVVFLTLEDEDRDLQHRRPCQDLFDHERMTVIRQPFLLVEGVLQH